MTQILLGAGQLAPQTVPAQAAPSASEEQDSPAESTRTSAGVLLLGGAAVASSVLLACAFALDPAGLPREAPVEFLGKLAASPGAYVAGTVLQLAAMVTSIATAVVLVLAFRRRTPWLAGTTATLLTLGTAGGIGFVGLKLAAIGLTENGGLKPGGAEAWIDVQNGAAFFVLSGPLACAVLGTLLATVLLVRNRSLVGWWVGPVNLLGAVLGSGELPEPSTVVGPLVQGVAVLAVVRLVVRQARA